MLMSNTNFMVKGSFLSFFFYLTLVVFFFLFRLPILTAFSRSSFLLVAGNSRIILQSLYLLIDAVNLEAGKELLLIYFIIDALSNCED